MVQKTVVVAGLLATALMFACYQTRSYRGPAPAAPPQCLSLAGGGGRRRARTTPRRTTASTTTRSWRRATTRVSDVLHRRRHRVVRERAPVPRRGPAAARRTRCGSRRWSTTSTTTTRRPQATQPFAVHDRSRRRARGTPEHRLVRIGLQARRIAARTQPPPRNLVFLVDVSGSMDEPDKLPLVKQAAGAAGRPARRDATAWRSWSTPARPGLVLPPTLGRPSTGAILAALDAWRPAARTNGGEGIQLAYRAGAASLHRAAASTA